MQIDLESEKMREIKIIRMLLRMYVLNCEHTLMYRCRKIRLFAVKYIQDKTKGRCVNMDKEMSLKNRDRLIQLGITISTFRKYRGLSQEQLAERASVSRSLISSIEAAGIAKSFSLEVFYNIADALEIEPATLLSAPTQFDNLLKQNT